MNSRPHEKSEAAKQWTLLIARQSTLTMVIG